MPCLKVLTPAVLVCHLIAAQTVPASPEIRRIYVDGIGKKASLESAKKDIIAELRRLRSVQVVDSPDQANAILTGDGEIYVQGFYSLNPRSGISTANGEPIYAGYLSVELKDSSGATLWSYLANTSDSKNAARELSKNIVKHLAASVLKKS